jgi:hypothetical protein
VQEFLKETVIGRRTLSSTTHGVRTPIFSGIFGTNERKNNLKRSGLERFFAEKFLSVDVCSC